MAIASEAGVSADMYYLCYRMRDTGHRVGCKRRRSGSWADGHVRSHKMRAALWSWSWSG